MYVHTSTTELEAIAQKYVQKAAMLLPVPMKMPRIVVIPLGTVGGRASYVEWTIKLNETLLYDSASRDHMLNQTIPHEIAHLVDYVKNPMNFTRVGGKNRSVHGPSWKAIMKHFGVKIDRCHQMDTKNSRLRAYAPRVHALHVYACAECSAKSAETVIVRIGTKHHKLVQTGRGRVSIKRCGHAIQAQTYIKSVKKA